MKKQAKNFKTPNDDTSVSKNQQSKNVEYPGYPLYPSHEDIMNRGQRIEGNLDDVPENEQKGINPDQTNKTNNSEERDIVNEKTNLTKDDRQALVSDEIQPEGDDEILRNRTWPVDFAGEDLDIPGSEQDDAQELIGNEDEENNSYSLGGDRHTDLEEDPS